MATVVPPQQPAPLPVEREKVVFLHTPKTGGAAMHFFLHTCLRNVRRNYFLSFAGIDESRFIRDEQSTAHEDGNQCVIERLFEDPAIAQRFTSSPHFQQAALLFGHATYAFGEKFPDYRFRYLMVLREPIERTISNIVQFSDVYDDGVTFASRRTRAPRCSTAYWDFIYDVLTQAYPVAGLLTHENLYLRNCMTHMLQGSRYLDVHEAPNLYLALSNAMRMQISFFEDFNAGIQRSLRSLGIAVDMSWNVTAAGGPPGANAEKTRYGRYYNAPQRVIDFVAEHNATDLKLYEVLKKHHAQG